MRWSAATLCLAFVIAPDPSPAQGASDRLELESVGDIRTAEALNAALDAIGARVKDCVAAKTAEPEWCFCRYPVELGALREKIEQALMTHPHWRDKGVSWMRQEGMGGSAYLSMSGIRQQLEKRCPSDSTRQ